MRLLRPTTTFLAVTILFAAAGIARAGCPIRPQDSIWLIDTCHAACPSTPAGQNPRLMYFRYDHDGRWLRATEEEFLAPNDVKTSTCFFLHGNQIDPGYARGQGLQLYSRLIRGAPSEQPFRLVIWAWHSEKIVRRPLLDIRLKADHSDDSAYQLAWVVNRMDPLTPISFIGHSFGARGITGALHILGGGQVAGFALAERTTVQRAPMRAVLIASATDCGWLLPGGRNELALSQIDGLLAVNNSCDRVLKRYRWLYGRGSCAEALGYVGMSTSRLSAADAAKIEQMDACCIVGEQHDWAGYAHSETIWARVRPYVFFQDVGAPGTLATAAPELALN